MVVAPLLDAHLAFVFSCKVLHADETPVAMLDPGSGKTRRAYVWAHELVAVRQAQRSRSVGVPDGCADLAAELPEQPD